MTNSVEMLNKAVDDFPNRATMHMYTNAEKGAVVSHISVYMLAPSRSFSPTASHFTSAVLITPLSIIGMRIRSITKSTPNMRRGSFTRKKTIKVL